MHINLNAPSNNIPSLTIDGKKSPNTFSVISLILFAVIAYYLYHGNIKLVVIIITVLFIHEMGHWLAMKIFNYTNLSIFFIPFFGAAASGVKNNASQKQEVIVLLSGPFPGILIGASLFLFNKFYGYNLWLAMFFRGFIFINLINLLPILPLDGGRMLKLIFLNKSDFISNIFTVLSAIALSWYGILYKDYIFIAVAFSIITALISTNQKQKIKRELEQDEFDFNTSYSQLTKERYEQARVKIIQHASSFKNYDLFEYDINADKEKLLANYIANMLQPAIFCNMTVIEKIMITILWLGSFSTLLLVR